jgi:Protein of unknown function (DUF2380)
MKPFRMVLVKRRGAAAAMLLAVLLLMDKGVAAEEAGSGEKLKVAFFGFELINTSPQPTNDIEKQRLIMIGDTLTQMLTDSGRYQLLPLTDALKQKIAASTRITGCNGCQIEWAREAGADLAVWGTVQKVSNLILNENVYIDDTKNRSRFFSQSVDIRGNTDESWARGMRYLLRNYLLEKR